MLERYLDNLTSYAETVYDTLSDNIDERRGGENGSIKQQRSTSPISRRSSIGGEARITENNHAAQSIAPRSPEDWEGNFEAPEEYLKPEQNATDVARETTAQGILRRFSTRRRQHANDHDDIDQSRSLRPLEIATAAESRPEPNKDNARRTVRVEYVLPRAETHRVDKSRARTPPSTTNSSGIKGPREIMRERAAREASRHYRGRSRSVSVPPKVDQQKRQVSEAAVAGNQIIAAHIAQTNSLRSDPQKQIDDVSQTENVYRRPPREPFGVGDLSPGTDQNQSDGNAPPQPRSATQKAKSLGHARRERVNARRARREALREANDSREGGVDDSNVSDMSTTPSASSMSIKPVFLKGLFSVSTTSTKSVHAICTDIMRVLNQLGVKFTEIRGGFSCYHVPSVDMILDVDLPAAGHRRRISSGGFMNGRDLNHSDSDVESINSDISRNMGRTSEHIHSELGGSMILEFEIFVVKVPLMSLHGIQFKRLAGGTWQYKSMAGNILRELRL
jgi:serine/threonine protein kinase KIN1/2